jgi:hypothetical protein
MPELLASIEDGWLRPEAIITHRLPLEEAAEGYRIFNEKREECRKEVLAARSDQCSDIMAIDRGIRSLFFVACSPAHFSRR